MCVLDRKGTASRRARAVIPAMIPPCSWGRGRANIRTNPRLTAGQTETTRGETRRSEPRRSEPIRAEAKQEQQQYGRIHEAHRDRLRRNEARRDEASRDEASRSEPRRGKTTTPHTLHTTHYTLSNTH